MATIKVCFGETSSCIDMGIYVYICRWYSKAQKDLIYINNKLIVSSAQISRRVSTTKCSLPQVLPTYINIHYKHIYILIHSVILFINNRWSDSLEGWSEHSICHGDSLLVLGLRRYSPETQPKDHLRKQTIWFNKSHGLREKTSNIFFFYE